MFSTSNMFVCTKRHRFTYLFALVCISVVQPLCHQCQRHYKPGASLQSKQRIFHQGCKKSDPVLYEKTAERHQRESPPFPPTHQWGCSEILPVCVHLWPENHRKCPPVSVLMGGFRRNSSLLWILWILFQSGSTSVPTCLRVTPTPALFYPLLLSTQPPPSEVSLGPCLSCDVKTEPASSDGASLCFVDCWWGGGEERQMDAPR